LKGKEIRLEIDRGKELAMDKMEIPAKPNAHSEGKPNGILG
jgi:hypothetical protein